MLEKEYKPGLREISGGVEIPGTDPFEILGGGGEFPTSGILVSAMVRERYEGVVKIFLYNSVKDVEIRKGGDGISINLEFVDTSDLREIDLLYENPNCTYKEEPPSKRINRSNSVMLSFKDLDIKKLTDGGRFMIEKDPGRIVCFRSQDFYQSDILRWYEPRNYHGVTEAVVAIMSKLIGTTDEDTELISSLVKEKLEL